MSQAKALSEVILRLIDEKFREGLVPCAPVFVDVVELPGEAWRGLWRVTAWGTPGEIAADVDVGASSEIDALEKARTAFGTRTTDEWREEMPVVIGEGDPS